MQSPPERQGISLLAALRIGVAVNSWLQKAGRRKTASTGILSVFVRRIPWKRTSASEPPNSLLGGRTSR
jgi:hypothetical protein